MSGSHLGLRDVVLSPGSRSTPLALAASQRRSCVCTCDSTNAAPASLPLAARWRRHARRRRGDQWHGGGRAARRVAKPTWRSCPLIVVTADRPPELHGVGAPQIIDQRDLYGAMVRRPSRSRALPGPSRVVVATAGESSLAERGRSGEQPGPVHLNAAFIEPLVGAPFALPPGETAASRGAVSRSGRRLGVDLRQGSAYCAWSGAALGPDVIDHAIVDLDWVVLGDATAQGIAGPLRLLAAQRRLRRRARPDMVVRLGGLPASKVLGERLREWGLGDRPRWRRLRRRPRRLWQRRWPGFRCRGRPSMRADPPTRTLWYGASTAVEEWLVGPRQMTGELNEPLVARAVVAGGRRATWRWSWARQCPCATWSGGRAPRRVRRTPTVASTGSTAWSRRSLGVGARSEVLGLVGDLTMLHDVSGLVDGLGPARRTWRARRRRQPRRRDLLVPAPSRCLWTPSRSSCSSRRLALTTSKRSPSPSGTTPARSRLSEELRSALEKGLSREGLSVIIARVPSRVRERSRARRVE